MKILKLHESVMRPGQMFLNRPSKKLLHYVKGLLVLAVMLILFSSVVLAQQSTTFKPPLLCVSGVMLDDENTVAVVEGQILGVGDTFGELEVLSITKQSVQFQYKGATFTKGIGNDCVARSTPAVAAPVTPSLKGFSFKELSKDFNLDKIRKGRMDKDDLEKLITKYAKALGLVFWLILLGMYIYTSLAFQVIAAKTNTSNGWFAWIPFLNLYLMCKIAQRPGWWFFLFFLPIANIIVPIILCIDIAHARGKSSGLGLLLALPIVNLIVLGHLAFSGDSVGNSPAEQEQTQEPKQESRGARF